MKHCLVGDNYDAISSRLRDDGSSTRCRLHYDRSFTYITTVWRYKNLIITITIIIFLCPRHLRYRGRGKNWLENVNAGMTISPGGLPPQNCCGAR